MGKGGGRCELCVWRGLHVHQAMAGCALCLARLPGSILSSHLQNGLHPFGRRRTLLFSLSSGFGQQPASIELIPPLLPDRTFPGSLMFSLVDHLPVDWW